MAFPSALQHRLLLLLLLLPAISARSKLRVGEVMTPLSRPLRVSSPHNLHYTFKIHADCTAALHVGRKKLWESNTTRPWGRHCIMELQRNGQLVIYSDWGVDGKVVWRSRPKDKVSYKYVFELQTDGNCVISKGNGEPIWSTQTNRDGFPQPEGTDAASKLKGADAR
ncbi:uncharacterized protein LOC110037718, partial [Phalaenopsis equestris]|uniref:uncharacterized protein LOC110037718 n=1 Tax=Phalaenopsis equestris TaxID=78828 RepID=UPI0009E24EAD